MKKIPITIITGFLGSGKTTLINKIIKDNKYLKIGIIVNEFGDIGLESQFIKNTDEEIVELSTGCMCCVLRKDIIDSVKKLIEHSPDINYIIIEASGLSDPMPIAQTLIFGLGQIIRIDSILCVVDSINIEKNFTDFEIVYNQLNYCDIILLSKTSDLDDEYLNIIKTIIKNVNPNAKILNMDKNFLLDMIIETNIESISNPFSLKNFKIDTIQNETQTKHTHEFINKILLKTDKEIDMKKLINFLGNLPEGIYRGKGFIYSTDSILKDKKYLFQYVGNRLEAELDDWDIGEAKQSVLLFLGKEFDKEIVRRMFNECIISND